MKNLQIPSIAEIIKLKERVNSGDKKALEQFIELFDELYTDTMQTRMLVEKIQLTILSHQNNQ